MSDAHRAATDGSNQPQAEARDILVVSELSVRSQNKTILEDVSFNVKKGTSLAIVGPNGGGKSTLFRALLNLIPYSGTIKWSDKIRMGYVPQSLVSTDLPCIEFHRKVKNKKIGVESKDHSSFIVSFPYLPVLVSD